MFIVVSIVNSMVNALSGGTLNIISVLIVPKDCVRFIIVNAPTAMRRIMPVQCLRKPLKKKSVIASSILPTKTLRELVLSYDALFATVGASARV